ncbi:putative U-box domain-containing protein 55 [Cryptomeria japonica]|uniref:putative U-box domain-containing protein 55 n=1 Tax=Cryptomeria japonica TaxID=3369 RepID=UPI0027D9E580|nr:putative U-box domain-containing protein 55 [Cryptomeria japonica]
MVMRTRVVGKLPKTGNDFMAKRPEASSDRPFSHDFVRPVSLPVNLEGNMDSCNKNPSTFGGYLMASSLGKQDKLQVTPAMDEISSELDRPHSPQNDVDKAYSVELEPPESQRVSADTEILKLRLTEALQAVANAKDEIQSEIARRKKAEAAAMLSTHKYKNLEVAFNEATKEKEEAISGRLVLNGRKAGQEVDEIHVPSFFLCPIFRAFIDIENYTSEKEICSDLQEVMQDPYIAADGFTYEKDAIQGWFDCGHDTSPMTNQKLVHMNLIPNFSLRSAIRQWRERGDLSLN